MDTTARPNGVRYSEVSLYSLSPTHSLSSELQSGHDEVYWHRSRSVLQLVLQ